MLESLPIITLLLNDYGHDAGIDWGDFDADGDPDLAVGFYEDYQSSQIQVWENTGGALQPYVTIPIEAYFSTFAWLDLEGDGDLELVADSTCEDDMDRHFLLYDITAGLAIELVDEVSCLTAEEVASGDLNGDGMDDLVIATGGYSDGYGPDPESEQVLHSTGANLVTRWRSMEQVFSYGIALGDYDADGDLDIAVANGGDFAHSADGLPDRVYANDGTGDFELAWTAPEVLPSLSVAWGDRDGDGDLDLAFGTNESSSPRIYTNEGGEMTLQQELDVLTTNEGGMTVDWGDWDGDGDEELALNSASGAVVYDDVGGIMTEVWAVDLSGVEEPSDLAWLDWEGDGDLDLSVLTWDSPTGTLRVYENLTLSLPEETGDTGLPSTAETGDTGATVPVEETADTSPPLAESADTGEPAKPAPGGCGCRTAGDPSWALGLLVLLRRRYARAASAPASTTESAPATLDQAGNSPNATVPRR